MCDRHCQRAEGEISLCGDGIVQEESGEECDNGGEVVQCGYGEICTICDEDCQYNLGFTPRCGDGLIQAEYETCDHAGEVNLYCPYGFSACEVCSETCELQPGIVQRCGDGLQAENESCDDGNTTTELCDYDQLEPCSVHSGESDHFILSVDQVKSFVSIPFEGK